MALRRWCDLHEAAKDSLQLYIIIKHLHDLLEREENSASLVNGFIILVNLFRDPTAYALRTAKCSTSLTRSAICLEDSIRPFLPIELWSNLLGGELSIVGMLLLDIVVVVKLNKEFICLSFYTKKSILVRGCLLVLFVLSNFFQHSLYKRTSFSLHNCKSPQFQLIDIKQWLNFIGSRLSCCRSIASTLLVLLSRTLVGVMTSIANELSLMSMEVSGERACFVFFCVAREELPHQLHEQLSLLHQMRDLLLIAVSLLPSVASFEIVKKFKFENHGVTLVIKNLLVTK